MAGLQLGGLVSGMDTSTVISQLLAADTQRVTNKKTEIQSYQKQQKLWKEIKSKMMTLSYTSRDLSRTSTFMTKKASSTSEKVSATATAGTANATYNITNVTAAKSGSVTGSKMNISSGTKGQITGNTDAERTTAGATYTGNTSTTSGNRRFKDYTGLDMTYGSFTINGANISITEDDTLNLVATKINAANAGVTAKVTDNGEFVLESNKAGDIMDIDQGSTNFFTKYKIDGGAYQEPVAGDMYRTFKDLKDSGSSSPLANVEAGFLTLNGYTFEVKESDSMSTVLKKINTSNAGVNAYFDETTKQLTMTAKDPGKSIELSNDTSNFLKTTGVLTDASGTQKYSGTGSSFTINGINMTSDTNEVTIDGTTIKLNADTTSGEVVTVNVTNDSSAAVDKIKDFVDQYNEIVGILEDNMKSEVVDNTDQSNRGSGNYTVSKGLLNGDPTARSLLQNLRRNTTERVNGIGNGVDQLSLIGITISDNTSAKLTLDESKLKSALNESPEDVFKLFSNSGKETTKTISGSSESAVDSDSLTFTSGTVKVNGKSIVLDSTDSLTSIVDKINASGAGVTASYSGGKFKIASNTAGGNVTLDAGTSTFFYKTSLLQETSPYDGVAKRVDSMLSTVTKYKGTIDQRIDYYDKRIDDATDWITTQEKRINSKQEMYTKQFAAMEKAMSISQSQSSWLSSYS